MVRERTVLPNSTILRLERDYTGLRLCEAVRVWYWNGQWDYTKQHSETGLRMWNYAKWYQSEIALEMRKSQFENISIRLRQQDLHIDLQFSQRKIGSRTSGTSFECAAMPGNKATPPWTEPAQRHKSKPQYSTTCPKTYSKKISSPTTWKFERTIKTVSTNVGKEYETNMLFEITWYIINVYTCTNVYD